MKLNKYTTEELECMPYDEIAFLVLIESGKKEKLLSLYKKICKLLGKEEIEDTDKISEFFEILTTNKKFIMLDNGYWDLQVKHKVDYVPEDTTEEELDPEELEELEENSIEDDIEEDEDIFYDNDETDDTAEDDLANLIIISDEEEERN